MCFKHSLLFLLYLFLTHSVSINVGCCCFWLDDRVTNMACNLACVFTQFAIAYSSLVVCHCHCLFAPLPFLLALDLQRMICFLRSWWFFFYSLSLSFLPLLFYFARAQNQSKIFSVFSLRVLVVFFFFFFFAWFSCSICHFQFLWVWVCICIVWQIPFTHYLTALQIRFRFSLTKRVILLSVASCYVFFALKRKMELYKFHYYFFFSFQELNERSKKKIYK